MAITEQRSKPSKQTSNDLLTAGGRGISMP